MKHLHRLSLDLVVADAIGSDEDLSPFMGMPVVDNPRFKHHIVKSWRPRCVLFLQNGGKVSRSTEGGALEGLLPLMEHQAVSLGAAFHLFGGEACVLLIGDRSIRGGVCGGGVMGVKNYDLGKPAVRGGPVPMANPCRAFHHIPLADDPGGLSLLLVVSHAAGTNDDHTAVAVPTAP